MDLRSFRLWGADHRSWRPATSASYVERLGRADRWLRTYRRIVLPRASTDSLMAFLVSRHIGPASRNGYISAMRAYYSFLQHEGRRRDNPAAALPNARQPRTVPRALTEAEVAQVLAIARARSAQWHVAIGLLVFTGARASEACGVRWTDVSDGWVLLHGKGGHQRTVPAHETLRSTFLWWREACPSTSWVLPGREGGALRYQSMWYLVNEVSQAAGIPLHPHTLRGTFATVLMDRGADVRTVQQLLGHANVATTSRYLAARDHLAKDAVAALPW